MKIFGFSVAWVAQLCGKDLLRYLHDTSLFCRGQMNEQSPAVTVFL